jgi:hypothetical protein
LLSVMLSFWQAIKKTQKTGSRVLMERQFIL